MNISSQRRDALTAKAQSFTDNIEQAETWLLGRGISIQAAEMFHLGVASTDSQFAGRLSIPYWTPNGVVSIKYRCIEHQDCKGIHATKYMYESGLGHHLYNAHVLMHAADRVAVTEGELDALCVQAYCGIAAVAYPGADTWNAQKHWRLCFEGVGEVIVVADGDDVGRKAAHSVAKSIGLHARVADLPDGYDANQFIAERGAAAFEERVTA